MAKYTNAQVGKMTSEEYKEHFNNDPEFRTFIDGGTPAAEVVEPGIVPARPSPRSRAELATLPADAPAAAATPGATSFDPAFDDEPTPPAAAAVVPPVEEPAPAAIVPPAPIELPEQTYEYVITDDNGKQIGGKQVFKYRTQDELIEKLKTANIHVRRMAQKLKEEQLLSGTDAPEDTTPAQTLQLRARLTAEERTQWEEKVQDPATAAQAQYMLDRDDDRGVQNELLKGNYESRVLLALESFKNRNREYVPSQDNAAKLVGYIDRRGLDSTNPRNWQKAYDVLRESGVISDSSTNQATETVLAPVPPTVREEKTVPNAAPAAAPARISEPAPAAKRTVAPIPTGLSNADSTSDTDNPMAQPHWLTVRVYLKDGQGKPTSQFQEFHDLDAVTRLEGKSEKEFYNSQSPEAIARRAKYEDALIAKETRLAAQKRKRGW